MQHPRLFRIGSALLLLLGLSLGRGTVAAAATTVFTTDFESGIPPEFSLGAGVHSVTFGAGRRLAAGVYFAKLTAGRDVRTTPVAIFQ